MLDVSGGGGREVVAKRGNPGYSILKKWVSKDENRNVMGLVLEYVAERMRWS